MLHIRATESGAIQATAAEEMTDSVPFAGAVPEDFYATLGLGKYMFLNGAIVPKPDWQAPSQTSGLLGADYVFTQQEITEQVDADEILIDISAYYEEPQYTRFVRVVGNFTKYFKREIVLATEVFFSDYRPSKLVTLTAHDGNLMPDGQGGAIGEYTYLMHRIENGENPSLVITQMLHFRASAAGGARFA